jgi:RND superfamily putative drug exporter
MTLFGRWGKVVARRARWVAAVGAIATVGLYALATIGVNGEGLFQRVETGPPSVAGSESDIVRQALQETSDPADATRLASYVRGLDLSDPDVVSRFEIVAIEIARQPHVDTVTTAFGVVTGPDGARLDTAELRWVPPVDVAGTGFLVDVRYVESFGDDAGELLAAHQTAVAVVEQAVSALEPSHPDITVDSFSSRLIIYDFTSQIERDLITGELIALPAALIVMVLVFGGFLAAATPLTGALASISGGLAVLYGMSHVFNVDQSAVNVVTVLGIGLSIDYGLLFVSRFREEMKRRGGDPLRVREPALIAALETAGRTVAISGIIVAVSVGGMLFFKPEIMRSFGAAGLGVVATAMVVALTLVPAVAYLLADRIARPSVLARVPGVRRVLAATSDVERDEGAFSRLAGWTQRRPWLVIAGCTALLLVLASPVLGIQLRNSEVETLPIDNERREYLAAVYEGFPHFKEPGVTVLSEASPLKLDEWMAQVAEIDGVREVRSAEDRGGQSFAGIILDTDDAGSADAVEVVQAVRALDAPFPVYVGGQAAIQIDFVDAIKDGALVAGILVVLVTFVLLFLMTGSLLVPLKTLLINGLSLAAAMGFVVWVFQHGNLEGLLAFSSPGGIETYVAVLIVAFGFGLAMDYEVFLLSRVKEFVDAGMSNDAAVRAGLQRSGRIITSAAAVIVLVFLGFAFGKLLMIKEVGVGLAFAVLLDATIVRMLLVPATMTVLGPWNWWAPAPLRRWHEKFQVKH